MNSKPTIKYILEAVLLSATTPLTLEQLKTVFDDTTTVKNGDLTEALALLEQDYSDRSIELILGASGYRVQTRAAYKSYISRLYQDKPGKYSRALLETLAIIAYRQPVTRADIEAIRGVTVSTNLIRSLLERNWVKVAGQRNVPGKPSVYITTKAFLDYFNLTSLQQLPELLTDTSNLTNDKFIKECMNDV